MDWKDVRRPDEQTAITMVFDALRAENSKPIEDKTIEDNPDCVFELSGRRIAADCTNVNLERLLKWSNSKKRLEKDKQYEVKFALEPHHWIKKSIEEKESKINRYRANSAADEVWLVAHALEIPTLFDCNESTIAIMKDAVRYLNPGFDQVWFVHSEYAPTRLWATGDPQVPSFPRWDTSEENYPSENIIQFKGTITKDGLNVKVTFGDAFETVVLQPIDSKYTFKT